jgi:tRNA threonylcarbamoyladenosine biosynthesis protein TsaB
MHVMKLVALDASTDWISVAAADARECRVVDERASNAHAERAMPLLRQVLADMGWGLRDLDAIAFGAGPGAFTGVRIACAIAQGLALGTGLPLVPVGTLAALAEEARHRHGCPRVIAALDARMREVYVAAYEYAGGAWREAMEPRVAGPDAIDALPGPWAGAGDAFARYPDLAARLGAAPVHADVRPSARAIAALAMPRVARGDTLAADRARPLYVRHRVALTRAERDAGLRL